MPKPPFFPPDNQLLLATHNEGKWQEISALLTPFGVECKKPQEYNLVAPEETGDTFARNRLLPPLQGGDLVAIKNTGAYGAVMASSYNTRPLVPEVLVEGEEITIIRPRPTYDDLIGLDTPSGITPQSSQ